MTDFKFYIGNILQAKVDSIVIPVNTKGVMGAGLAKQAADAAPQILGPYQNACSYHILQPGNIFVIDDHPITWIMFATKDDWHDLSKIEWIQSGLNQLADILGPMCPTRVAIPALGAGLGGLSWHDVEPEIISRLDEIDGLEAHIFLPKWSK